MGEDLPLSKKCIFFQQLSAQKLYYSDIGKLSKITTVHRHYSFPPNPLKLEVQTPKLTKFWPKMIFEDIYQPVEIKTYPKLGRLRQKRMLTF